jgi:antirestriction protein
VTTTTTTRTKPACIASGLPDVGIYIACLASYNGGILQGAWVDLELCQDEEDIQEGIDWVLATSPEPGAEEWAMHDSAGLPSYLSRTEWPEDEREAYRLECENQGETIDEDAFRATYCGCYSSGKDYAYELAEEIDAMPKEFPWPLTCIDWQNAWRELTYDGYREEDCSSGGVHIFRSC